MIIGRNIEEEAKKLDEKIKKLKEQKAKLAETLEADKQKNNLAFKLGLLLMEEYQGKDFEYDDFKKILDEKLTSDFEREFFGFQPLSTDDPRRPKKRGRKKNIQSE